MREHARRRAWRVRPVASVLERLEDRRLLAAFYAGPSYSRVVHSSGGEFEIAVSGGGLLKVDPPALGGVNLRVFGTTTNSTLTISQVRPRWHYPSQYLVIKKLTITSGQIGSIDASAAELNGAMTPLSGGQTVSSTTSTTTTTSTSSTSSTSTTTLVPLGNSVDQLELGAIGPKAQIRIGGNVGVLTVSQVDLGPTGEVVISGQINTDDLTSTMDVGSFVINGGRFVVGEDSMAPIAVNGSMTISHDGLFSIGRDLDGGLTVNGNVTLDTGGQIFVGRNASAITTYGNLIVNPSGSGIVVNGELSSLSVGGILQGQGGTSAPTFFDVGVGLNLGGLIITGGTTNQDGLINANIRAGGDITGVDIAYNLVNSTIQPNTPPPPPST